jgi:hypothetical protein
MEIKTKFNLGDTLWKIHNSKAVSFKIGCIFYDGATYYGETRYDMIIESECFPTKEALMEYVASE